MLTKDEIQQVITQYNNGTNATVLSQQYSISSTAIYGLLKRRNISRRKTCDSIRKYPVNTSLFESIDSEPSAYILGLLYADGYNSKNRNQVILQLKDTDRQILDDITKILQPSKPLQFIDRSRDRLSKPGTSDAYRLTIANKQLSNRLCELGCGYNKTFDLKFPEWLNSKVRHHFIRGYFDGDGSISPRGGNSMIAITGYIDFIKSLQLILASECDLSITKLAVRFKHIPNIVGVRYCGPRQLIRIRDYLYRDATLYLNRKHKKFSEVVSTRNFRDYNL